MRRFFLCVVCALTVTGTAMARQDEKPKPTTTPRAESKETPKPATSTSSEQSQRAGQLANIRLEVTITDQRGSGQPTTKTVALVMADYAPGRLRTSGDVRTPQGYRPIVLNVDARPALTRDGRIRASVTLEYRPSIAEGTSEEQVLTTISESFEVILEDGKPLVVSQSADPYSDRRVKVELKAAILK